MRKFWEWLKATAKRAWAKVVTAISKYNWRIRPVFKGIDGLNTQADRLWLVVPSLFTRGNKETATVDIGVVWFGFGVKLNIEKK